MRRHGSKEIVESLRLVEKSDGKRPAGRVTELTYHRRWWRNTFGGLDIERAKWHDELECEIARLSRIVSDLTVSKMILADAIADMTPMDRSVVVLLVMTDLGISERRACQALGQHRSTQRKIQNRRIDAVDSCNDRREL
jgi:putative transposase